MGLVSNRTCDDNCETHMEADQHEFSWQWNELLCLIFRIDFSAIIFFFNAGKRNKIDNVCATLPCGVFS
jgi:hypothetical protein